MYTELGKPESDLGKNLRRKTLTDLEIRAFLFSIVIIMVVACVLHRRLLARAARSAVVPSAVFTVGNFVHLMIIVSPTIVPFGSPNHQNFSTRSAYRPALQRAQPGRYGVSS